uniref:Pyruvate ferredoxin oxidoreductase n=1 Tax=Desulfatirhabdium butyrativorans TaxID=340467 RepID=A0A7C4RQ13_9BACT
MPSMSDTTRLIIVAVGGQGNLLASSVLGEAALMSGIPFRMSEIHGMAQRGGVVESAMVFGNAQSNLISDGEADVLVGFEPLETLRAMNKCNPNTVVITNVTPLPPFTVAIGKGVYPPIETILELIRGKVNTLISLDATAMAREAGNILAVNMVLLGALAQSGTLPLNAEAIRKAIGAKTKPAFLDANLKAFDLGVRAAT